MPREHLRERDPFDPALDHADGALERAGRGTPPIR